MPDYTQEQGPGGVHDGDVRKLPVTIVGDQRFNDEGEEGVVWDRAHCIVGDACGLGSTDPGRVREKRVEAAVASLQSRETNASAKDCYCSLVADAKGSRGGCGLTGGSPQWLLVGKAKFVRCRMTYIIQVDVDTTVVGEDKVSNCICALDGVGVVVKGGEEPRVFGCYQFSRLGVGP